MISLEARTTEGKSRTFRVPDGRVVTIGRSSDNTIVLPDASVSRHHAELIPEGDVVILHDRGSFNGTFLDGQRVLPSKSAPVRESARLHIGRYELFYERVEDPTETVVLDDEDAHGATLLGDGTESIPFVESPCCGSSDSFAAPPPSSAERLLHRLRVLEDANRILDCNVPLDRLQTRLVDLAFASVDAQRGALFIANERLEPLCQAFAGDTTSGKMHVSRRLLAHVLNKRECVLHPGRDLIDISEPRAERLSLLAVPLWGEDCFTGALYVESRLDRKAFDEEDLRVLQGLGRLASSRIENAMLLDEHREKLRRDQELTAAAAVQRRLLPSAPMAIAGYACDATNVPCYEVGGDFFDYLELGQDRHGIVLADVAGKGLAAAMLLMGVQAYVRAYANLHGSGKGMASFLNGGLLTYAPRNRFVSLFFAELDAQNHRLTWFNAGHAPPPFLIRATGEMQRLDPGGLALGILPDSGYPVSAVELLPGDLVMTCSDGVIDATDPAGEPFGDERLEALALGLAGKSPAAAKQIILDAVRSYSAGAQQTDDLTVVTFARERAA